MSCGNKCYEIGGPWISEDPDCPVHGTAAQMAATRREETEREVQQELAAQEKRIARLEALVSSLRDAMAGIRGYRDSDE